MRTCTQCFYRENHPFGIVFNAEGLCSGCVVHEEKNQLDWSVRDEELARLLGSYKSRGANYDCIIPVSGGKDSFFIVDTIKNKYGLNPLLAFYNTHYQTATGIRNFALLRETFGCDVLTQTISPDTVKKITRATLRRLGSVYWHCIAGNTVWPVQLATRLKIPLIIWGAHQGLDQVGMFSHNDYVEMTRKYRKEHDLMGVEAEDLISDFDGITEEDVQSFIYPDDKILSRVGVRGIYLNNYIRWDSKTQHESMIAKFGFETRRQVRTFDSYNNSDCWVYSDLHDWTKYLKHGYGKVTDHASRDIRLGHMSRDQGEELIKVYSCRKPLHTRRFSEWLGVTPESLNFLLDQFRSENFWDRDDNWNWVPSPALAVSETSERPQQNEAKGNLYLDNLKQSVEDEETYILIGKGWPRQPCAK